MVGRMIRGALLALACRCALGVQSRRRRRKAIPARTSRSWSRSAPAPAWTCWRGSMPRSCRQALGKPVVVENKPGAATMLAAQQVATAPPDGYTLVVLTSVGDGDQSSRSTSRSTTTRKRISCRFRFIVKSPFILVVEPEPAVQDRAGVHQATPRRPKPPLNYASVGAGGLQHLSMEFAKQRFGFEATHVPYRQTGQSVTDLAAGHVDVGFVEAGASIPLIKEGKSARARGVVVERAAAAAGCAAVLGSRPARRTSRRCPGTFCWRRRRRRRTIVDKLHAEMKKIMSDPDMKEKPANIGLIPLDTPSVDGIERLHQVRAGEVGRAGRASSA